MGRIYLRRHNIGSKTAIMLFTHGIMVECLQASRICRQSAKNGIFLHLEQNLVAVNSPQQKLRGFLTVTGITQVIVTPDLHSEIGLYLKTPSERAFLDGLEETRRLV